MSIVVCKFDACLSSMLCKAHNPQRIYHRNSRGELLAIGSQTGAAANRRPRDFRVKVVVDNEHKLSAVFCSNNNYSSLHVVANSSETSFRMVAFNVVTL